MSARYLAVCSLSHLSPIRPGTRGAGRTTTPPLARGPIMSRTRRELFTDVGTGMLTAALGSGLVVDLGLGTVRADEAPDRLTFGKLEPLVDLLQSTPANKLQPLLVEKLRGAPALRDLVPAP